MSGFIALPFFLLALLLLGGLVVTIIVVAAVSKRFRSAILSFGAVVLVVLVVGWMLVGVQRRVPVGMELSGPTAVVESMPRYSVNVDDGRGNRVVVDKSRGIEVADSRGRKVSIKRAEIVPPSGAVEAEDNWSAFLADVYPSAETAAEALSRELLSKVWPDGKAPAGAAIRLSGGLGRPSLLRVAEKVRSFSGAQMALTIDEMEAAVHKAALSLTFNLHGDSSKGATLEAARRDPDGNQETRSVKVVEAAWAADFADFGRTASQPYLLAQTHAPAASAQEAYDAALSDAAGQLDSLVRERVRQALNRHPEGRSMTTPIGMTLPDLRNGVGILDGFAQVFDRPYGKVYRQILLVDCSEGTVQGMARSVTKRMVGDAVAAERVVEQQRWTWAKMAMSIAALVGLTILVYALLNAATKGYYSWVLRIVAVVLIAGGILFVVIA